MQLIARNSDVKAVPAGERIDAEKTRYIPLSRLVAWQFVIELVSNITAMAGVVVAYRLIAGVVPSPPLVALSSISLALSIGAVGLLSESYRLVVGPAPAYLWSGALSVVKTFALLFATLFAAKISDDLSRFVVLGQFASALLTTLTLRAVISRAVRIRVSKRTLFTEQYVVIGDEAFGAEVGGLASRPGSRMLASMVLNDASGGVEAIARRVVELCRSKGLDRVVICTRAELSDNVSRFMEMLAETPVTVEVVPDGLTLGAGLYSSPLPTATILDKPLRQIDLLAKRSFDIAVAGIAICLLGPIFVLIALAIRLETKGPVLFRQIRHGYNNNNILVFKFRSMRVVEDGTEFRQATKNDSRITKVGRFLRRTNLDELPQLVNVLIGDMSIVGPRPHPVALNESFAPRIRLFNRRHNIKPGITGWAQINGFRGETDTLDKMLGRVEHDLWYVDNWSVALDLRIMALTVFSSKAYRNAG